jgi:hypothetical protein
MTLMDRLACKPAASETRSGDPLSPFATNRCEEIHMDPHKLMRGTADHLVKPPRNAASQVELFKSELVGNNSFAHVVGNFGDYYMLFRAIDRPQDALLKSDAYAGDQGIIAGLARESMGMLGFDVSNATMKMLQTTQAFMIQDPNFEKAFTLLGADTAGLDPLAGGSFNATGLRAVLESDNPREAMLAQLFLNDESLVGARMGFSAASLAQLNASLDASISNEMDIVFGK